MGDAAGELVGQSLGRHHYRVFPWNPEASSRTLEGSLAVFAVGSLGAAIALLILGVSVSTALPAGLACGAIGSFAEALSGQGSDNLWVQLLPSLLAWWLVG
jgi:dolichol kinase